MPAQSMAAPRGRVSVWPARRRRHTLLFCYLALAPVLALFAYIRAFPIAWSVILSFHRWDLIGASTPFVGFANYVRLAGAGNFWLAVMNPTIYSIATVIVTTLVALPLAVVRSGKTRLAAFY